MRKMKVLLPVLLTLLCSALILASFAATAKTANEQVPDAAPQWEAQYVGAYNAAPTTAASGNKTEIDFTGYTVVCSGGAYVQAYAQKVADRLSDLTGTKVTVSGSTSNVKRGIYIGQGNGVCQQALKDSAVSGKKCAWTVQVLGKNIALAGTNNLIALEAVDYFYNTYLCGENMDATIEIDNKYTAVYDDADAIAVFQPATKTVVSTKVTATGTKVGSDVTTLGTDGTINYAHVIYDNDLDHDASYNNDSNPDKEYSKINMGELKDTSATGYSLDKNTGGDFAWVKDTSHDNSSYPAGVISYDGDYILVHGNRVTVPSEYCNGSRGQTFSINSDGLVEIRNRGWFSSDYYTIGLQGLGSGVGTGNDYVYDRAAQLADAIQVSANTGFMHQPDTTATSTYEILVGNVDGRTQDDALLSELAPYEYGIAVIDGKIVLNGHSTETQQYATETFHQIMKNALIATSSTTSTTSGANTVKTTVTTYQPFYLPEGYKVIGTSLTNWSANSTTNNQNAATRIEDAVLPSLTLNNVADGNDGSVVLVYRDTDISLDAFNTYCSELEAADYERLTESTLAGSYFKTYANYQNGITLTVSYCAFNGKNDYEVGQQWGSNLTEKYFAYSKPQIRVVVAHLSSIDLPTTEILNPNQTYTKVTDSAITSIDMGVGVKDGEFVASYGTGYVMLLEDGRFIIIDGGSNVGGMQTGYDPWAQVDTIYNVMADLYTKAFGFAPSNEKPITIAAWIATHGHGDHINAVWDLGHKYGAGDLKCSTENCYCGTGEYNNSVRIQYVLANAPARSLRYNTAEANEDITKTMATWQKHYGGFTYVKVHTGQTYYFANLTIETLFTVEDLYPQRIVTFNDTSSIMRLTFRSTSNAAGSEVTLDNSDTEDGITKTSFISDGDIYVHGSRWLTSMYGNKLKADMVSMGHHGGPGAEGAFYDLVAAETIWWSHSVDSVCGGYATGGSWYARIDQYAAWGSDYTKYVFVADAPSGNANVKAGNLTLFLRAGGPDYDNLYNAGDVNLDRVVDETDEANRTFTYSTVIPTVSGKNVASTDYSAFQENLAVAYKITKNFN